MISLVEALLGLHADELTPVQMAARAVLTFVVTVVLVRLGNTRLFGKATAFDLVVAIMVGSVMSRAITNASGLVAIWLAGAVLILLHRLMATIAFRFNRFGPMLKGNPVLLAEDGQVQHAGMRKGHVSAHDLEEAQRMAGEEPDQTRLRLAYLERDGSISVVPRHGEPRIVEVSVEDNVKVVRVSWE